jgi:hypothetical protein
MPKAVLIIDGKKPCSRCKQLLPVEQFSKQTRSASGYQSDCKQCRADVWLAEHPIKPVVGIDGFKTCTKCKRTLPVEEFYKRRGGYRSDCKLCCETVRKQRKRIPGVCACGSPTLSEHIKCAECRQKQATHVLRFRTERIAQGLCYRCKKPVSGRSKYYCFDHAEQKSAQQTKRRVVPYEEQKALFVKQNGICPVCTKDLDVNFKVDHNHETGEIRGLLHHNCNIRTVYTAEYCFDDFHRAAIYLGSAACHQEHV